MISCFASIPDIKKAVLTSNLLSTIIRSVGRKRINDEQMPARFPAGTLARIDAVLRSGEKRADVIRIGVERELKRRERAQAQEVQRSRNDGERGG